MEPKYQPAAFIGALGVLVAAIFQVIDTAVLSNGEFSWLKVLTVGVPLLAGFLIKQAVVTRAWLREVISGADTVLDALRPIVEEVDVPPELRPTRS